jgi:hypothetical protein
VRVAERTWAGVKPNNSLGPALPTLLLLDTRSSAPVELAVLQAQTLDLIYSVISLPTTRQPGRAHVVVFFVKNDANQAPVEGVTVNIDGAETVIYDDGVGTFTDVTTSTGAAGLAILANIPAQAFPGKVQNLVWSGEAAGFEEIYVAADSVTFVGYRI